MTHLSMTQEPAVVNPAPDPWQIQVFAQPPYAGTTAWVYALDHRPTQALLRASVRAAANAPGGTGATRAGQHRQRAGTSARLPPAATCFIWPRDASGTALHAACYSDAGAIRCCGHGLLACAFVGWQQRLHSVQPDPSGRPQEHAPAESATLQLSCGCSPTALRCALREPANPASVYLDMPLPAQRPVPVPDWSADAFGAVAQEAVNFGGKQEYLLLRFHPGHPIQAMARGQALQRCCALIKRHTRRAVIITQALAPAHVSGCDYALRYFAPQYGVTEDAVTGSAHRLAAAYWAGQGRGTRLRGWQCSPGGGVVACEVNPDHVAVGGTIHVLASPARVGIHLQREPSTR